MYTCILSSTCLAINLNRRGWSSICVVFLRRTLRRARASRRVHARAAAQQHASSLKRRTDSSVYTRRLQWAEERDGGDRGFLCTSAVLVSRQPSSGLSIGVLVLKQKRGEGRGRVVFFFGGVPERRGGAKVSLLAWRKALAVGRRRLLERGFVRGRNGGEGEGSLSDAKNWAVLRCWRCRGAHIIIKKESSGAVE